MAVKRNNGVRRITKKDYFALRPGPAAHDAELAHGILGPLLFEVGHQGEGVGKKFRKKHLGGLRSVERGEAHRALVREEEGHREAAVGVGQADQHVAGARPDVQGFALDRRGGVGAGRNQQLLVSVVNDLFGPFHGALGLQGFADSGIGSVGRKHGVKASGTFAVRRGPMNSALSGVVEVSVVLKVQAYVGVLLGLGHEGHIDSAPRNRPNGLTLLAVGLGRDCAVDGVHHAAVHRNRLAAHGLSHTHRLKGAPAAVAEGEVDRASAFVSRQA